MSQFMKDEVFQLLIIKPALIFQIDRNDFLNLVAQFKGITTCAKSLICVDASLEDQVVFIDRMASSGAFCDERIDKRLPLRRNIVGGGIILMFCAASHEAKQTDQ